MKRIILIGCGGSGKSTLAMYIGKCKNLPVIHLDSLFWKSGWIKTPSDEWHRTIQNLLLQEHWVMDGNFGSTLDIRIAAADTIIFFDLPTVVCIWRAIKRRIKFHNKSRPDMGSGCLEQLDLEFLNWIWTYRRTRRSGILKKLQSVQENKRVIILESLASVKSFEISLNE